MVKIGILSALAFVLMRTLEIPLPIFPAFLKIDFGDIPALIGTLVIHPAAGVVIVIIKNILALFNSSSGGVGEIANIIVGIAYIIPIAFVTQKKVSLKNILLGSLVSIVLMIGAGILTNALMTMPLYGEAACVSMGNAINPNIVDKWTFLLYVIAPFNFIKGIILTIASIIIVKAMMPALKQLRMRRSA